MRHLYTVMLGISMLGELWQFHLLCYFEFRLLLMS